MSFYWKLDQEKNVVPATMEEFSKLIQTNGARIVKQETYKDVYISTVFLGLSHSFDRNKPGNFFETMILKGPYNTDEDHEV